ncbi:putative NRPS-like protein biosynthetic cluster [Clathrus columnatus]|uniref:NRPS-like protein biosynthetic cluster n=1 Tax=Clathrus columnatus TaxID=1419009 RepID=A0AAV5AI99_9AGAM|nr:putative NRPS-like protein biosynthetic cluster [Clathrus columnatus]
MSDYSSLFTLPPKDHEYTIDQLYQWHSVHSSKAPTFIYPDENRNNELVEITWTKLEKAILTGVQIIRDRIPECCNGDPNSKPFIVGVLATTNIITYTAMLYAHLRLSHSTTGRPLVPFLISPRNSPTVVQHIVQESGALYLWTSEGPMKAIAEEAVNSMPEGKRPTILSMPSFEDLYSENISVVVPTKPEFDTVVVDKPALILHSSGSTAFPKLRTLTHRMLREWCMTFEWSEFNMFGQILGAHAPPIFHAMGVFVSSWAAASGLIRAVQYPKATFTPLTAESYLEQVIIAKATVVYCVPSYLEEWAKKPETFPVLRKLNGIFWGGAPLSNEAEKTLFNAGAPLFMVFGLTEFGMPVNYPAKPYPEGGDYFKFSIQVEPILVPQEGEEDVYEVVMKDTPLFHITNFTSEIDGVPVYETNDLVQPHPINRELYRVIGRKDDQLMLSTGEKTNPGPLVFIVNPCETLETIIQRDSHVQAALYFGRGRISNGVLIQPKSHEEVEKLGIEAFRNLIWPSIQKANEYAPAHSRVFKEMILISSAEKPFAYTAKNTPRRGIVLKAYDKEIDDLYKLVEQSSNVDLPVPLGTYPGGGWTMEEGLEFVRKAVYKILGEIHGMTDEDDIFTFNCDSLQATMIKNTILHALRQVTPVAVVQALPGNFVYQHPTIRSLANFATIISQSRGNTIDTSLSAPAPEIGDKERHQRMEDLIKKYTQQWPVHTPRPVTIKEDDGSGDVVLLTGSTGGLGSQLLARLLVSHQVSKVYAFNRPQQQKSSYERHVEVFLDRGNDVELLKSSKLVFVEGDTSVDGFGIDLELFNEIRNSVTTVIHNAWRVDFNISLSSFEPAIRGVRKLIDFALGSPRTEPPRILFTSSIGIVKTWLNIPAIKEEPITDLNVINTNGYSESKWVCERILTIAEQETSLKPVIIRVGQLSGGLNGHWNVKEWFSGLVRASQIIGAVPENDGVVSFVPIHIAASAILELRHTSIGFAHLVHPRPSSWKDLIGHITDILHVPTTISYSEWFKRLESLPRTEESLKANPALHLVDFYGGCIPPSEVENRESRDAIGLATYETTRTVSACVSLSPPYLPVLSKEEVEGWIGYWRVKGALD